MPVSGVPRTAPLCAHTDQIIRDRPYQGDEAVKTTATKAVTGHRCDLSAHLTTLRRVGTFPSYLPAFSFRQGSPDSKLLAGNDGELETLVANGALTAYRLCGAGRGTPLWKEEIRVGTPAIGKVMPRKVFCVQHLEQSGEQNVISLHVCNYVSVIQPRSRAPVNPENRCGS